MSNDRTAGMHSILSLSIIVVTWNSSSVIGGFISSIPSARPPDDWELIVVDNASSDDTLDVVRRNAPAAHIIANPKNLGLARANNQGISHAGGRLLLIANPDIVLCKGSIEALMSAMNRHPRAAWVVPRLIHEDGTLQTSAGDLPTFWEALLGRQVSRRRSTQNLRGFWWDKWAHDEERRIGRGHEAAYLVRQAAVLEVGPQDPRYVLDWEGVDWTDRFRRAGWEIWIAPEAEVLHLGGTSIRQVPVRWVASQHLGMYLYFSTRMPAALKPLVAALFASRAVLKIGLMALGLPMYRWGHRDRRQA